MSGALKHPNPPALVRIFHAHKLPVVAGMNLLQEGPVLLISDNCVWPEEVAACDVAAVEARVLAADERKWGPRSTWGRPASLRFAGASAGVCTVNFSPGQPREPRADEPSHLAAQPTT